MNKFEKIPGVFPTITGLIEEIEHLSGNAVLFACEQGSRVWGYDTPASDHDIKIVMKEPADKVFSLFHESKAKSFRGWIENDQAPEGMTEVNFTCWSLQRALELVSLSDVTIAEAVRSPIVWHENGSLRLDLEDLCLDMDARRMAHRYRGTAKQTYLNCCRGSDDLKPRDVMQVMRHIIAAQWIVENAADGDPSPPMSFSEIFENYLPKTEEMGLPLEKARALFDTCKARDAEALSQLRGDFTRWTQASLDDLEKSANRLPEWRLLTKEAEYLWKAGYPEVFGDPQIMDDITLGA